MTRRTLQINRPPSPSRRRSDPRPTCESVHSRTSHRCVLDPGHRTDHFAEGTSWTDMEAAA